jgi:hypothetical protein
MLFLQNDFSRIFFVPSEHNFTAVEYSLERDRPEFYPRLDEVFFPKDEFYPRLDEVFFPKVVSYGKLITKAT